MYDFILFENYISAKNHYKDLMLIYKMLKDIGYSVAVADVFNEKQYCDDDSIEFFSFDKTWADVSEDRVLSSKFLKLKISKRLDYCIPLICRNCKYIYAGSYYVGMPFLWLYKIPHHIKVIFWGLRSNRLVYYKNHPISISCLNSFILNKYVFNHQNCLFFVSDEIIKKEFIELGIAESRLILRPERTTKSVMKSCNHEGLPLRLLSIGSLRPEKRIEQICETIAKFPANEINYTIAGKVPDIVKSYSVIINDTIKDLDNVERLNYRIPEKEYNELILDSDFLILCDKRQESSVTNGTMNEALLNGIPIIAPNYDPYKHIINQYGVGIMFDPDNETSMYEAVKVAISRGKTAFENNLKKYQESLLYDRVLTSFQEELDTKL